jgi:hypothetical protein
MTGSYDLGRASNACAATGEPLTPGSPIVAALVDVPGEEDLARVDTLASAWDRGLHPSGLFAFWRTTVPPVGHKPKAIIDDESLLDLFQSLDPAPDAPADDRRLVFRYILALLLIRRRRLAMKPDTGAADGILRARIRGAEEGAPDIEVAIPSLDAESLAAATDQLSTLIGTGA